MKPVVACLGAVFLTIGCGGDTERPLMSPTAVSIPVQTLTQKAGLTHKMFGTVTTAGVPVSDAEVAELETVFGDDCFTPRELSGTRSDASGSYVLPTVTDSSTSTWASWVRAYKAGYFTDFQRPRVSQDMRLDFTLDPWTHVSLGQTIRGTVDRGDQVCRGNSYGLPGSCHRFAITVPTSGTLEVTLTWPNVRPDVVLDVVRPGGIPCALFSWPGGTRHSLKISAEAGATYEVRVVDDGNASPLTYELTTSLR
jgi:hypothetical protein